ncbi:putative uncharacterized hydrolase C7D4.05 [Hypsizygus marmoreus]|uniref:Uncharacterized hydrolase C7D4.05 n=1 Tax=Hypsizygus marmoreus TaxID=39966 RepID=A0A369JUY0_HYPMA|nr:putative uncharacterized hydrolase C7D4.05 [Hypsizygus marmoreus]
MALRLVTFDALYTIIIPRLPVHVQYSQTFEPYLGTLQPDAIRESFRVAFRTLEAEQPAYAKGSQAWWTEVIKRTALGAGADEKLLDISLPQIVPRLMGRFSSKEGYRAFDDTIPALRCLSDEMNILTAVVSNADSRLHLVLQDLGFPASLNPVVLSEEEGIEKPSPSIFLRALARVNAAAPRSQHPIRPEECLHIGDELVADYNGARAAGMQALLLRRAELADERVHKGLEAVSGVEVVKDMDAVIRWRRSKRHRPYPQVENIG